MAELTTVARSEVDYQANRKAHPTEFNRLRAIIVETPAVWSAANGYTFATHLVIPAGSRIKCPVGVSNGTGAAASTLSLGLRDAVTKAVFDANAILNAVSLTTAQTAQFNTGTVLLNGQFYLVPKDAEVFGTFGGAAPTANQAIRCEINFVSP